MNSPYLLFQVGLTWVDIIQQFYMRIKRFKPLVWW